MIIRHTETKTAKREIDAHNTTEEIVLSADIDFYEYGELDACPTFQALTELCETETEKKFLRLYYTLALGGLEEPKEGEFYWSGLLQSRSSDLNVWFMEQSKLPPQFRDPRRVSWEILKGINAPALLPQVWVRYEFGNQKTKTIDLPSRVDFAFFHKGEMHAVEIDGPSHFGRWDEQRRCYVVDEGEYGKTLKATRSLRDFGWRVHRFSRLEIEHMADPRVPGSDRIYDMSFAYELLLELFGPPSNFPNPSLSILPLAS
jgi:hypothetical protein